MRIITIVASAAVAMALSLADARASGGLSCTADDAFAEITIESGVTRGMGGPVFNFRATSLIRDDAVAGDLRAMAYEGEHLAQYWLDGEELRLLLYRERAEGAHGYVEIEVRATVAEEGLYTGVYALTVFDLTGDTTGEGRRFAAEGAVECFVE
jgi:hypothetical protein